MRRNLAFAMRKMQGAEGVKWGIHVTFVIVKQTGRLAKNQSVQREANTDTTDLVILQIALPANPAQKSQ